MKPQLYHFAVSDAETEAESPAKTAHMCSRDLVPLSLPCCISFIHSLIHSLTLSVKASTQYPASKRRCFPFRSSRLTCAHPRTDLRHRPLKKHSEYPPPKKGNVNFCLCDAGQVPERRRHLRHWKDEGGQWGGLGCDLSESPEE